MSTKRKTYSADFKAKLGLQLSREHKQEAMKYFIHSMKYLLVDIRVAKGLVKLLFFNFFGNKL